MTCIIALKNTDGKIYMGADKCISNTGNKSKKYGNKILQKDGFTFGFAGNHGAQDIGEMFLPQLDFSNISFEDLQSKLINTISLFKIYDVSILLCSSSQISMIETIWENNVPKVIGGYSHQTLHYNNYKKYKNIECVVIGTGHEIVYSVICSSLEIDPEKLIRKSIDMVSSLTDTVSQEYNFVYC